MPEMSIRPAVPHARGMGGAGLPEAGTDGVYSEVFTWMPYFSMR